MVSIKLILRKFEYQRYLTPDPNVHGNVSINVQIEHDTWNDTRAFDG